MFSNSVRVLILAFILSIAYSTYRSDQEYPSTADFPLLSVSSIEHFPASQHHLLLPAALLPIASGLLVADAPQHHLTLLDEQAHPLRSIGHFGQGPGELILPLSIDTLPDGTLAVLDKENQRVQRFSPQGRFLGSTPIGADGLRGLACFPDGTIYTSRNGPLKEGDDPFFSVVGIAPDGSHVAHWEAPSPVLDVRREKRGNVWVLCPDGLSLYSRKGRLLRRLAVPPRASKPLASAFTCKCMVQAGDGKVYVGGWGDTLVYGADYRPLGKIPSSALTRTPLDSLAVDDNGRLWAADDRGHLVRVTLPN